MYLLVAAAAMLLALVPLLTANIGSRSGTSTGIVYRCGKDFANLCAIHPSGKGRRRLTTNGRGPGLRGELRGYASPSLSRDGTKLAFAYRGQAYVARSDGSDRKLVMAREDAKPVFVQIAIRPSGRRVLVVSAREDCPQSGMRPCFLRSELFSVASDGDDVERITEEFLLVEADWAGKRIVFSTGTDLNSLFVLAGESGGVAERVVRDRKRYLFDPAVSPDGKMVAVETRNLHGATSVAIFSLTTGRLIRNVTRGSADFDPAWSRDGKRIAFTRNQVLHIVRADGRGSPRSLRVHATEPTWGG